MFTGLTCRYPAVFLAGLSAGFLLSACSKGGDRPRMESASSTESRPTVVDTAAPRADTAAGSHKGDTTTQPADTPVKKPPSKSPSPPKPSIDPGRKSPKPITVPSTAVKPSADSSPAAVPAVDQWLKYDASTNTVTFELNAGPFNFNGYTSGGATLAVPSKANMVINFVNKDGTPHSGEVISGDGPIPNAAVDPAIPRAYTNKVLEGLPQEAKDVMRFAVPESGKYRIFCGVPGHGLSGMWIWLKVDPAAKAPSFGPTKS
jgi:Sulfocyanin (SoxE) domain